MTGKPLILCVDDRSSLLEGRQMLLEENGYKVLTAMRGRDAVHIFASNPVDLVLLDYHMPQMDGGVAAMHMRACKPDVPIALLSGDEWLPPRALEAVDAFISKSEPIISFLEKVDYLLSLRFLFQPLDSSWADEVRAQHKH
jgi:CheY-like chemotaxis protein